MLSSRSRGSSTSTPGRGTGPRRGRPAHRPGGARGDRRAERQRQDDARAPPQRPAAADRGRVRLDGTDAATMTVAQLAARVGLVFQDPGPPDLLRLGPRARSSSGRATSACAAPAGGGRWRRPARHRAGGPESTNPYDLGAARRKLLALASVLAMETPALVLDEPTTGQDARGVERVREIVDLGRGRGSHGDRDQPRHALRGRDLRAGGRDARRPVILDGTPGEVFAPRHGTRCARPISSRRSRRWSVIGWALGSTPTDAEPPRRRSRGLSRSRAAAEAGCPRRRGARSIGRSSRCSRPSIGPVIGRAMTLDGTSSSRSAMPRRPRRRSAGPKRSVKSPSRSRPNASDGMGPVQQLDRPRRLDGVDLVQAELALEGVERAICLPARRLAEMRRTVREQLLSDSSASRTRLSRLRFAWVMVRILRDEPGWEDALARALERAPRPIPLDERLLPRTLDGEVSRRRFERADFPPARPAATLLAIYPDAEGRLVVPLTVRHGDLRLTPARCRFPAVRSMTPMPALRRPRCVRRGRRSGWRRIRCGSSARSIRSGSRSATSSCCPSSGRSRARPALVPHDAEVAAIVELPLAALWDPDVWRRGDRRAGSDAARRVHIGSAAWWCGAPPPSPRACWPTCSMPNAGASVASGPVLSVRSASSSAPCCGRRCRDDVRARAR